MRPIFDVQLIGLYVMAMLAVAQFALSINRLHGVTKTSALLMGTGSLLLSIHFAIQCDYHFHEFSTELGALVNLSFCMICSYFYNTSLLYLMRQGHLNRLEWWLAPVAWLFSMAMMSIVILLSDTGFHLPLSPTVLIAEKVMAFIYGITLIVYNLQQWREFKRLKHVLSGYVDHYASEMISWMKWSMLVLALGALFVPIIVFQNTTVLTFYVLFIITVLLYVNFTFALYAVSRDSTQTKAAYQYATRKNSAKRLLANSKEKSMTMSDAEIQNITDKIEAWKKTEAYLTNGITLEDVAIQAGISKRKMMLWQIATQQVHFRRWISQLRIEYAKQLIRQHPNWSQETIALHCQFTDRSNFARAFKKEVGMTPQQWLEKQQ